MVSVPMETDPGGLVGVLDVHTVERREFTDRDVELLLVIGRLIAGARGTAVGTGRQNTLDMLAANVEPGTAARLCADLDLNGVRGWFLPSRDELALMYRNLKATGAADFRDGGVADNVSYWASSQQTADMAAHIDFADLGRQHGDDKDFPRRVRAIRAI